MSGALREIAVKRTDVFHIDPRELMVKPEWNARMFSDPENKEHIQKLKTSIRAVGVLEPLTVFREDGKIYISDGHCRHQAILDLLADGVEIVSVPVKTEGKGANEADALLRQALEGKPKTAYELGHVFKRLLGYGWTVSQVAERSGKGVQSVEASLRLQEAPVGVQKLVESGRVSGTLAVQELARRGGNGAEEALTHAVETAAAEGKTRATAKHLQEAAASAVAVRKSRLAQVAEIIERAELDEENYQYKTALVMSDHDRTLLFRLLDI